MNLFKSRVLKRNSAFLAGVLAGLAAPGSIGATVDYPRPQGSDLGRLRGDTARVGSDFSTVIRRENGKQGTANKARSAA